MSDEYWRSLEAYEAKDSVLLVDADKNQTKTLIKILKILSITLLVVLAVQAAAYFVVIPYTTDCSISFSGLKTIASKDLQTVIAKTCGTNWLQFDTSCAANALLSVSSIESATVQKNFPNQIVIDVKEREAVAIALANIDNRTVPVQIDQNGVVFAIAETSVVQNFPLITGLTIDKYYTGMVLDSKYQPLIQQVSEILATNPSYFKVISEILIEPKEYDSYELVIYPVHTKIRVLMDRNLSEEQLEYMMVALDVVNSVNPQVTELDLRYGTISYKVAPSEVQI